MQILQKAATILNKKSTFYILCTVTFTISIILFILTRNEISGDYYTYLYYIKGFENGRYTFWYFLKDYVPDTFRNPGYPLFLFALHLICKSVLFTQCIQWLLLLGALFLMTRIIGVFDNSLILKNLFLLLVCVNFVTLYYATQIYPETLVMFLITLIVYVELTYKDNTWKKTIILVFLYACCFQVRPVVLFFPFIRAGYFIFKRNKLSIIKNVTFLFLFILTLLPYGFWNLKHHHKFKITPLEGGAGVFYLGYWNPKMIGYLEDRYFRSIMFEDLLINLEDKKNVPANIKRFNAEWDSIDQILLKYLSNDEISRVNLMKSEKYSNLFPTYNAEYTTKRENILKELAIRHYWNDWFYTIKLKTYTFFRIWYSGFNLKEDFRTIKVSDYAQFFAFITTFSTLLLMLFYIIYSVIKNRKIIKEILFPLFVCLYFDIFHLPFTIQSRYTIPVRLLYLFCLAFMIYKIHFTKFKTNESHKNL